jgi:hypothetical protein
MSEDWDKADEDIPIDEPIESSEPVKVISLRSLLIHTRILSPGMRWKNGLKTMTRATFTANN